MDYIEFYTENLEFKFRVKKELRAYSLSEFSKYKITIEVLDSIDNIIISINTFEKELLSALYSINSFIYNYGEEFEEIIYFNNNGDFSSYFIYLANKDPFAENPTEDDDIATLSFYHTKNNVNSLVLYFETKYQFLEQIIYNIFSVIEDIPNLQTIINKSIRELY